MALTDSADLLFAGGDCVLRHGVWVRRTSRVEDIGPTHTRSGAIGKFTDRDGTVREAEANQPRVTWLDLDGDGVMEQPALLLEAARTNLVDSDDFSAWTDENTTTVAGSISDPAGGTSAYRITGDGGATDEGRSRTVAFTGDAVKTMAFVVKEETMPASGNQELVLRQTSGTPADRLSLTISAWTSGEPTVAAATGTYLGKVELTGGWWAIYGETTSVTAAETNVAYVRSNAAASAGAINVWRVNAYNATVPGFSILDASETRNADVFYADFPYPAQAITAYWKGTWLHDTQAASGTFPRLFSIGQDGNGEFAIYLSPTVADQLIAYQRSVAAAAAVTSTLSSVGLAYLSTVEARLVVDATGRVLVGASVDSAAESVSTYSAAQALNTFGLSRAYICTNSANRYLNAACQAFKVARDVRTMAYMRALD